MIVGVNFRHDPTMPIGFDPDPVRALRPALVRACFDRLESVPEWIEAARRSRLRVLWRFWPDRHGSKATRIALEFLMRAGADTVGGIEVGSGRLDIATPALYLAAAIDTAELARSLGAGGRNRPIILNTGAVAGAKSPDSRRIHETAAQFNAGRAVASVFDALAVSVTLTGFPWPTFHLREFQARAMDLFERPPAVIDVGWRVGADLHGIVRIGESIRAFSESLQWRWLRTLDPDMRRRWYLEASVEAQRIGAVMFLASADVEDGAPNRWGLYSPASGTVAHTWHSLQWHAAQGNAPAV